MLTSCIELPIQPSTPTKRMIQCELDNSRKICQVPQLQASRRDIRGNRLARSRHIVSSRHRGSCGMAILILLRLIVSSRMKRKDTDMADNLVESHPSSARPAFDLPVMSSSTVFVDDNLFRGWPEDHVSHHYESLMRCHAAKSDTERFGIRTCVLGHSTATEGPTEQLKRLHSVIDIPHETVLNYQMLRLYQ